MKRRTISVLIYMLMMSSATYVHAQTNPSQYKLANKFSVEGDGGFDLLTVDEASGRIFLSHGNSVQVIDEKTGKLLGTIANTKGVHGIALAADLNKGYISNGKDTSVTIFDMKSLAILGKVTMTGAKPDAIVYDPASHKTFVFNGKGQNATVIDGNTDKVVSTIALEGKPELAVVDGKGKIYVNIENKNLIAVINSQTLKVEQKFPIAPGKQATGIALDNENHRLFTVTDNKLMIILDALTGKVITSLPIGADADGAAFDPIKKRAYSSNAEGTLTVITEENANTFKVLETVNTQKGAKTIAIDTKTHHIYLPTAEFAAGSSEDKPKPKPGTFIVLDFEPSK